MKNLTTLVIVFFLGFALASPALAADKSEKTTAGKMSASSNEETLKKIDLDWTNAYPSRDTAVFTRVIADDWMGINPDGTTSNKTQQIDEIKSGAFAVESMKSSDVKIRVFGNAAVITGLGTLTGKQKGKDVSGDYRYMDVYVKREGKWQAVASQVTAVAKDADSTESASQTPE